MCARPAISTLVRLTGLVDFYDPIVEALHCTSPRDRMCTRVLAHAHLAYCAV